MASGGDVLTLLRPNGGWVIYGDDYDSIRWDDDSNSISKEEFERGFAQVEAWKREQEAQAKAAKQAILDRLGLTEDELRIVLT